MIGPIVGAIVGGGLYMFFVELRWGEIEKLKAITPAEETELQQIRTDKQG